MALFKGKERAREQAPVLVAEKDVGVDEDEGDSSSEAAGSDEDGASGSLVGSLAFTSGPNSLEDAGNKSPRQAHVLGYGSPHPSPLSSPLRACFPEPGGEEPQQERDEETRASSPPKVTVRKTRGRGPTSSAFERVHVKGLDAANATLSACVCT